MIECSEDLGFALEPHEPIRIVRKVIRQQLQCNVALEFRIVRAKNDTHTAFTQR
jgi:hypothetical protein